LYEIRERPSKIYHWRAFLIAAVLAEIPWNLMVGTLFFFGWYFPVGKIPRLFISNGRILAGCYYSSSTSRVSMAFLDGLAVVHQHFCSINLLIRKIVYILY
jgi:ABC-type multidrug transport system permease subunit